MRHGSAHNVSGQRLRVAHHMTTVHRALAISMVERYLMLAVALGSNMLIARLLTPEQIGLYSVSLAVISLAQMVRDFGIGSYLIQHKDLQDSHVRTAFGVMLIIGGSLFAVFFVAGPFAGRFYNDPRVGDALRICALNFLVLPFCTITMSLLRREMRFDHIAIVGIAGGLTGALASVGLAWAGLGPIGLAIGSVISSVVTGITAWLVRRDSTVFKPSLSEWRAVLGFGGQSALTNVVSSASNDISDLALGKVLGFAPVAMISRAQGLPNMFQRDLMGAVQGVAFPMFAKVHREGASVETKWTAAVGAVTVFGWPFYGFLALMSVETMRLLFGNQWDTAARLVPIFCAVGAVLALANLVVHLLIALGRMDIVTRVELTFQPARAAAIVVVAVLTESLAACAWAYLASAAVQVPLLYWVKSRCLPFDWTGLRQQLKASAAVTLVTLALPAAAAYYFGFTRTEPMPLAVFLGTVAGSALVWVASVVLLRHPLSADPVFQRTLARIRLARASA